MCVCVLVISKYCNALSERVVLNAINDAECTCRGVGGSKTGAAAAVCVRRCVVWQRRACSCCTGKPTPPPRTTSRRRSGKHAPATCMAFASAAATFAASRARVAALPGQRASRARRCRCSRRQRLIWAAATGALHFTSSEAHKERNCTFESASKLSFKAPSFERRKRLPDAAVQRKSIQSFFWRRRRRRLAAFAVVAAGAPLPEALLEVRYCLQSQQSQKSMRAGVIATVAASGAGASSCVAPFARVANSVLPQHICHKTLFVRFKLIYCLSTNYQRTSYFAAQLNLFSHKIIRLSRSGITFSRQTELAQFGEKNFPATYKSILSALRIGTLHSAPLTFTFPFESTRVVSLPAKRVIFVVIVTGNWPRAKSICTGSARRAYLECNLALLVAVSSPCAHTHTHTHSSRHWPRFAPVHFVCK